MNGCEMPVVINSGSGNQGITCSVPVIAYAKKINMLEDERLYRALVLSNLITIHIKNSIGKLSAFCGVVIAGTGCGAGIAYLEGGDERVIAHTIVNSLAIISGVVCDGAKSSCAAKIASLTFLTVTVSVLGIRMLALYLGVPPPSGTFGSFTVRYEKTVFGPVMTLVGFILVDIILLLFKIRYSR